MTNSRQRTGRRVTSRPASAQTLREWQIAAAAGVILVAAGAMVFFVAPVFARSPKDVGNTRTSAVQLLAGLVLGIGALYTVRTYKLTRTGQITERFARAIEQLGDKRLEVRLGGIYALEQIAKEPGSDHHPQIMDVLTAFVRKSAPWPPQNQHGLRTAHGTAPPKLPADIQAVLTVLGRRDTALDTRALDLSAVNLRGLELDEAAAFDDANFANSRLELATLVGVQFRDAVFSDAYLNATDLSRAVLRRATFERANLERAIFVDADLMDANLKDAVRTGTIFVRPTNERQN